MFTQKNTNRPNGRQQKSIQTFFRPSRQEAAPTDPQNKENLAGDPVNGRYPAQKTLSLAKPSKTPNWWDSGNKSDVNNPAVATKRPSLSAFDSSALNSSKKPRLWPDLDKPARQLSGSSATAKYVPASKSNVSIVQALLSPEQKAVLKAVVDGGQSIFFTGAAGTGKSHLLRQIVAGLYDKYGGSAVAVTATTGLAAFNIGGQTVHSWGGIGVGSLPADAIVKRLKGVHKDIIARWKSCKVLVIDEISMLSGDLFDKLEHVARLARNDMHMFGGIQVVCTGDFFQLPPVSTGSDNLPLCFEAKKWSKVFRRSVVLTKVFRQTDTRLVDMLNSMRHGKLSPELIAQFKSLARPVTYDDGLEPTRLFSRREPVLAANNERMAKLSGKTYTYTALDVLEKNKHLKHLFKQLLAPQVLHLKVGAQVMLIYNINPLLVNGRRGKVIGFVPVIEKERLVRIFEKDWQLLKVYNSIMENGGAVSDDDYAKLEVFRERFPDRDLEAMFAAAQRPAGELIPLVDFYHGCVEAIGREQFYISEKVKKDDGFRSQLPLCLSWALSIHKSQGLTLDRLVVDLSQVFEKGQAYVAVSRATSFDRLQVLGFKPSLVKADSKVSEFYNKLEEIQPAKNSKDTNKSTDKVQ